MNTEQLDILYDKLYSELMQLKLPAMLEEERYEVLKKLYLLICALKCTEGIE